MFTPHARGSTFVEKIFWTFFFVYPACAGIDHGESGKQLYYTSLPRMRGDRPTLGVRPVFSITFTPHARGSTLNEKDNTD